MTQTIEATYENGVLVPVSPLALANHDRVKLVIEPIPAVNAKALEMIRQTRNNRLAGDQKLAAEIALSPEFDLLDTP